MTQLAYLIMFAAMRLILASSSPYRKAQMQSFGLRFEAYSPAVDEEQLKLRGPADLVALTRFLAREKALSLRQKFPGTIILGSDQLIELDGARLDKPGNHAKAKEQLLRMQGRAHRLITSLAVLREEREETFTDVTTLTLRPLTEEQIETYLRVDQPFDCAGSYKIERAGLALIAKIESEDPSAIQGLPMMSLCEAFNRMRLSWNEIWP